MKNLLVIMTRGAEEEVCRLFVPFWEKSGCDLVFSLPIADIIKPVFVKEGLQHFYYGDALGDDRSTWWKYQARALDTMKACLLLKPDYDGYILTQYDSICLGPLPIIGPDDSVHHLGGGEAAPFKSTFFLHPPWCFGRNILNKFVEAADHFDIKTTENGVMDRWIALVIEKFNIPWKRCEWSWSVNSIDTPEYVASAREAIKCGKLFIHGVKNKQQLDAILQ